MVNLHQFYVGDVSERSHFREHNRVLGLLLGNRCWKLFALWFMTTLVQAQLIRED